MINKFSSSWIICVEESMFSLLNPCASWWVTVKIKSHPMDIKYHTATSGDTKILYCVEIFETNDKKTEGSHSMKEFEEQMYSNIVALVVRMYK